MISAPSPDVELMERLDRLWIRVVGFTPENKTMLRTERGIDIDSIGDIQDDETYLYFPLRVLVPVEDGSVRPHAVILILGEQQLITVQDETAFPPFDAAFKHICRHKGSLRCPRSLLCLLLHVLNEHAGRVIVSIGAALDAHSSEISDITRSLNTNREVSVADISQTMIDLNDKQVLLSACLENQLALARAARYLDAEVSESEPELQALVRSLREDINGVKEHALYEHDAARYLQNAVLASLNVKQNQIVKVFTIITAVFLPPTLIATFYGMNFSVMPELSWRHGFPVSILLTLVAALLPLVYIKRRGWLR